MRKKDLNAFRIKSLENLKEEIQQIKINIFKTKAEIKAGREKDLKKLRILRRKLAQLLTLVKEKEIKLKEKG